MEYQPTKHIAILGSTGSIGTQTLDIIERYPLLFKADLLVANNRWQLLAEQALKFRPKKVVIANKDFFNPLKYALDHTGIEVEAGEQAIAENVKDNRLDIVVTAMVGYSGLIPTIEAIKSGKTIALANKETLVVAGEIITELARIHEVKILPVDSEHSAIFQCLVGENHKSLKKILLTASGGPFRKLTKEQLKDVTVQQALSHPNWNMGAKVTIDSASMMNKGFEMIEARWLFNCLPKDIQVLVHPQSIVHSMVEFCDGSVKAQLGVPDMRLPIQYALSYPHRLQSNDFEINWEKLHELTFELPDYEKFPLLGMAFKAIEAGGNMPCILNAANEIAVKSFIDGRIPFIGMPVLVDYVMEKSEFILEPSLQDLVETNKISRKIAQEWINTH